MGAMDAVDVFALARRGSAAEVLERLSAQPELLSEREPGNQATLLHIFARRQVMVGGAPTAAMLESRVMQLRQGEVLVRFFSAYWVRTLPSEQRGGTARVEAPRRRRVRVAAAAAAAAHRLAAAGDHRADLRARVGPHAAGAPRCGRDCGRDVTEAPARRSVPVLVRGHGDLFASR